GLRPQRGQRLSQKTQPARISKTETTISSSIWARNRCSYLTQNVSLFWRQCSRGVCRSTAVCLKVGRHFRPSLDVTVCRKRSSRDACACQFTTRQSPSNQRSAEFLRDEAVHADEFGILARTCFRTCGLAIRER